MSASPDEQRTPAAHASTEEVARLSRRLVRTNPTRSFRVGLAIGVLLAVATVLLVAQNSGSVQLTWLVWDFQAPLWLFLLLSAASGAVLLQLGLLTWRLGRRRTAQRRALGGRLQSLLAGAPSKPTPEEGSATDTASSAEGAVRADD